MIEIKEGKLFNFATIAEGQGFSFGITAQTREEACESLLRKLQAIVEELRAEIGAAKGKRAN